MGTEAGETSPQLQSHLSRFVAGSGDRLVFAVGGDGTVRACVHALAYSGVALAIVPAGHCQPVCSRPRPALQARPSLGGRLRRRRTPGGPGGRRRFTLRRHGGHRPRCSSRAVYPAHAEGPPGMGRLRGGCPGAPGELHKGDDGAAGRRGGTPKEGAVSSCRQHWDPPGRLCTAPRRVPGRRVARRGDPDAERFSGLGVPGAVVGGGKHHPERHFERYTASHVEVTTTADLPRELDGDIIAPGRSLVVNVWHRALLVHAPRPASDGNIDRDRAVGA